MINYELIRNSYRLINQEEEELNSTSNSIYKNLKEVIEDSLGEFLGKYNKDNLFLNYSFQKIYAFNKTSSILISKNNSIILHNRFFGQTLSNLNKIYYYSSDSYPMYCYLFRLIQEEFYSNGYDKFAILLSNYRKLYNLDVNFKNIFNENSSPNQVVLQEVFILVHEIIHYLFYKRVLDVDKYVNITKKQISNILNIIKESDENLIYKKENKRNNIIYSQYQELTNDKEFCEELSCDFFTLEFIKYYFPNFFDENILEESIFLLFQHIKILNYIKLSASNIYKNISKNQNKLFKENLRYLFITFAYNNFDIENSKLDSFINNNLKRYEESISKITYKTIKRKNKICNLANMIKFNLNNDSYEIITN